MDSDGTMKIPIIGEGDVWDAEKLARLAIENPVQEIGFGDD